MATVLLLYNTSTAIGAPNLTSGLMFYRDAKTSGTTSSTNAATNTVASATDVQVTTSSNDPLRWVSGRSPSGGWTLAGQVDVNLRGSESATSANVKGRLRLHKMSPDGTLTEIGGSPWDDNVELSTTPQSQHTWSFTPTSTAFAEDDRLVIDFRGTNIGTMGAGRTFTVSYGANNPGTNDSSITLTETVTFKAEETAVAKPRISHRSQAVARSTVH